MHVNHPVKRGWGASGCPGPSPRSCQLQDSPLLPSYTINAPVKQHYQHFCVVTKNSPPQENTNMMQYMFILFGNYSFDPISTQVKANSREANISSESAISDKSKKKRVQTVNISLYFVTYCNYISTDI